MAALFRRQALRLQQTAWLGSTSIVRPPPLRWLGLLAGSVMLALAVLLGTVDVAPRVTLPGVLLPDGQHWRAELKIPAADPVRWQVGQTARLRLADPRRGRPGLLTGRVTEVGDVLTVALDPLPPAWADRPLAAGLRLQADLLLERRRLWEWMLEPLLGLQQRL